MVNFWNNKWEIKMYAYKDPAPYTSEGCIPGPVTVFEAVATRAAQKISIKAINLVEALNELEVAIVDRLEEEEDA